MNLSYFFLSLIVAFMVAAVLEEEAAAKLV
jgi:hypothetical protein